MLPMLATDRLRLEPASSADLGRLHDLLSRPEARRYLCDDVVLSHGQVEGLLREAAALESKGLGLWSLVTSDDAWIGIVGLRPVSGDAQDAYPDFAGEVEPLIALQPEAWGKGYASEAMGRIVAYAFDALGRNGLVALVDEPNTRSHRLLERAGFKVVGAGPGPKHPLRAYSLSLPKRRLDSSGMCG